MTKEMQYLMYLYACAAAGVSAAPPKNEINWRALATLYNSQDVAEVVAYAVRLSPGLNIPDDQCAELRSLLLGTAIKNSERTQSILKILSLIDQEGIPCAVLKGFDAARLYACPDCRMSADTDVLINESDEDKTLDLLSNMGFTVSKRGRAEHHSTATRSDCGMIEVHVSMCEEEFKKLFFEPAGESYTINMDKRRKVEYAGGCFFALCADDALWFMTAHLIKHFIVGGVGLRMIFDLALYYKNNVDNIDSKAYFSRLERYGYSGLMSAVLTLMIMYCGFSQSDFPGLKPDSDAAQLLGNDLESGGFRGHDDSDRLEAWYILTKNRRVKKSGRLAAAATNRREILRDQGGAVLPPKEHLRKTYPVLKKHGWLYPAVCVCRLFSRGIPALVSGRAKSAKSKREAQLSQSARERLELFRRLGML